MEIDQHIPTAVITGYGDDYTALKALKQGAFYFIKKPFSINIIDNVIQKGLRLPTKHSSYSAIIPHTKYDITVDMPTDCNLIEGVNYQVASTLMAMGYDRFYYNLTAPFIVDELLSLTMNCKPFIDGEDNIHLKVEVTESKVDIHVTSEACVFKDTSYPAPLNEIHAVLTYDQ